MSIEDSIAFSSDDTFAASGYFINDEQPRFTVVQGSVRAQGSCKITSPALTKLLNGEAGIRALWKAGEIELSGTTSALLGMHLFLHLIGVERLNGEPPEVL